MNGHWAWACPHNPKNMNRSEQADTWRSQPQRGPRTSTSANNASECSIKVNFVDVNGNPFKAEIEGPLPEGVWMSEGNLEASDDTDNIGDTGASHNVTGDVSQLIHFRKLKCLIPLFVATEMPTAYITGQGTLMYQSDDRSPLLLDNVYYCLTAKRTLISIPAILEAGGLWEAKGKDMILIFPNG
ncbi:hypothetical protein CROQUDRAFT_680328, partial [Cronartium quercuum f. sp. fusiforme G11]